VILDFQKTRPLSVVILTGACLYKSPGPFIVYPSKTTTRDSMTSPAAAAAILVLFDSTASSANVIPFTSEITRMTAGTEWRVSFLIRIIVSIDTATYRSSVTASTAWIASVIAWVVTAAVMAEVAWCPAVC